MDSGPASLSMEAVLGGGKVPAKAAGFRHRQSLESYDPDKLSATNAPSRGRSKGLSP